MCLDTESWSDRDAALDRLLTYYLHTATTAAHQYGHAIPSTHAAPAGNPPAQAPTFTDSQQATDWFTVEQ